MNSALQWFTRTDDAFEPIGPQIEDAEENRLEARDLPAHVQEFLAMKAAAGF